MMEPIRYQKQIIDKKVFEDFFSECGDYNMDNLNFTFTNLDKNIR